MHRKVIVKSPINIALVKYWGKDCEDLIIPYNSSLSITLDCTQIFTETAVALNATSTQDTFCLNGKQHAISHRMLRCIQILRSALPPSSPYANCSLEINSQNNFPTAAGMASSASGISALVYALWKLFELEALINSSQLTAIARVGSGSACRSIPGGFVIWDKGSVDQPQFSTARSVASAESELRILIYVFSIESKSVSSTAGMSTTVKTSSLFRHRISAVVPERISQMLQAIQEKNWELVFELTIKDSNSFHACCLDSYPPIVYLNEKSLELIRLVCQFNSERGKCAVGYSFDAGANGFVFLQSGTLSEWREFTKGSMPEPIECGMGNGTELVSIE